MCVIQYEYCEQNVRRCVRAHTHKHTHSRTYIHTYTLTRTHNHTHTHTHILTHTHTPTQTGATLKNKHFTKFSIHFWETKTEIKSC